MSSLGVNIQWPIRSDEERVCALQAGAVLARKGFIAVPFFR